MPAADFTKPTSNTPVASVGATHVRPRRRRSDRLPNAAILIVEDDPLIADDLACQIARDGSTVVGPATTPATALALLESTPQIGGAILDVRLGDETAFEIAGKLREREIPFVFFTGYDDIHWPADFRATPKISKTADWRDMKRILFGPRARRKRQSRDFHEDVAASLPVLREAAAAMTGSKTRGDRLVERVLEVAIENIDERGKYPSVEAWLMTVLRDQSAAPDDQTLN